MNYSSITKVFIRLKNISSVYLILLEEALSFLLHNLSMVQGSVIKEFIRRWGILFQCD